MKVENSNFVDYVKIFCRSGKGGQGSAHFLRNKNTSKGGPDGGDGGCGGSVIVKGNEQMWRVRQGGGGATPQAYAPVRTTTATAVWGTI